MESLGTWNIGTWNMGRRGNSIDKGIKKSSSDPCIAYHKDPNGIEVPCTESSFVFEKTIFGR